MPSGRWTRSPSGSWTRCPRGDQVSRGTRGGVRAVLARWRGRDVELKTAGEIDAMRIAGALVAQALTAVTLGGPVPEEKEALTTRFMSLLRRRDS